MNAGHQSAVIDFLSSPSAYGGAPVQRIDTHASIVFLAGTRALKLKRAVRYDYLDYSTLALRQAMCEAELRINRGAAPGLYLDVIPVTQQPDGSLMLGGSGAPIEWLLEMVRFDQAALFDRMARDGRLPLEAMPALASTIARFHGRAQRRPDQGGWDAMRNVIDGNDAAFGAEAAGVLDPARCANLALRSRAAVDRHRGLLESRRLDGFVRECHGDLHLGNIVSLNGTPTLFDAIEFNESISCVDVLYDLAFVLMDLEHRGLRHHANALFNGYLSRTIDLDALALLPLFLSCRAAVRAKILATAATLGSTASRFVEMEANAHSYLTLAEQHLDRPAACVIAIGGPSGSGKSTAAKSLAPFVGGAPGAVVIRSDEIRKRLCGVGAHERLGAQGYTPEANRLVYETVRTQVVKVLHGGHAVIVDAVFAREEDRAALQALAVDARVPFLGVWLAADEALLVDRVVARGPGVSDATPDVVRRQLAADVGRLQWRRIDASVAADRVAAEIAGGLPCADAEYSAGCGIVPVTTAPTPQIPHFPQ